MKFFTLPIALLVVSSITSNAHAGLFGPRNYEECFKKNVVKAHSSFAANTLQVACKNAYEVKTKEQYLAYVVSGNQPVKRNDETGEITVYLKSVNMWVDLLTGLI